MNIKIPDLYTSMFHNKNGIVKYPNDVLRQKANLVESLDDAKKVISKMSPILRDTQGVGLAAPQIGVSKRIIVVRHEQRYALVNPFIEEYSGSYLADEGCLSVPGLWGKVLRHEKIVLRGTSPHGKDVVLKLDGMGAVVPQHEIDHLDGVMFFDKALKDSLYWWSPSIDKRLAFDFDDL